MQITKVTLRRIDSTVEDVNAETKGLGVQVLPVIAIGMSKRIGGQQPWQVALPNHSNAPWKTGYPPRKAIGRGFSVVKSRSLARKLKPRRFKSIFYRKNGPSQK
jgi:hypothetical protein